MNILFFPLSAAPASGLARQTAERRVVGGRRLPRGGSGPFSGLLSPCPTGRQMEPSEVGLEYECHWAGSGRTSRSDSAERQASANGSGLSSADFAGDVF